MSGCSCVAAEWCGSVQRSTSCGTAGGATSASGRMRYGHCLGTRPSRIGNAERSHRLCNHLERPRRQRGERRGQLRATVGRVVCWCMPLAREHHGDEHLEPLQATAPIISITASATALHPCAIGWSHATRSIGAATRARARLYYNSTALASSGVLYAYALVQCACAAAARRGWRWRTSARTAATHSCAASHE